MLAARFGRTLAAAMLLEAEALRHQRLLLPARRRFEQVEKPRMLRGANRERETEEERKERRPFTKAGRR